MSEIQIPEAYEFEIDEDDKVASLDVNDYGQEGGEGTPIGNPKYQDFVYVMQDIGKLTPNNKSISPMDQEYELDGIIYRIIHSGFVGIIVMEHDLKPLLAKARERINA